MATQFGTNRRRTGLWQVYIRDLGPLYTPPKEKKRGMNKTWKFLAGFANRDDAETWVNWLRGTTFKDADFIDFKLMQFGRNVQTYFGGREQ